MDLKPQTSNDRHVELRQIADADLPLLYSFQLDPVAARMAVVNPRNPEEFQAYWNTIRQDPLVTVRAVIVDNRVAGSIACYPFEGHAYIGYWLGQSYWGRGIASRSLEILLQEVTTRPLYARVAKHNLASIKVLQRNGFILQGYRFVDETERYPTCEEALLMLASAGI